MRIFRRARDERAERLARQKAEVGHGWTCHVCGDYRPDARISVHSSVTMIGPVPFQQNVRYCNDRPDCVAGASRVSWAK